MQELINVSSYHASAVGVKTKDSEYLFEPSDGVAPSVIPMTRAEIVYINSSSNVFRIGLLAFDEDVREEMYKALRIVDWKDILTDADLEDILKAPTLEGLQRIVDIKDGTLFERVRAVFYRLKNDGHDLSVRVEKIVRTRYCELRDGKKHTAIVLSGRDAENVNTVDNLQAEVARLTKLVENMQKPKSPKRAAAPKADKKPADNPPAGQPPTT